MKIATTISFIVACFLCGTTLLAIVYLGQWLYRNDPPKRPSYDISGGKVAMVDDVPPQPITQQSDAQMADANNAASAQGHNGKDGPTVVDKTASADPVKGKKVFAQCAMCHTAQKDGANRLGPALFGVVDRQVGTVAGFRYSHAMQAFGQSGAYWDEATLDAFLHAPRRMLPKTSMAFVGVRRDQDRADLIAYLRSLSDDPAPSPPTKTQASEHETTVGKH